MPEIGLLRWKKGSWEIVFCLLRNQVFIFEMTKYLLKQKLEIVLACVCRRDWWVPQIRKKTRSWKESFIFHFFFSNSHLNPCGAKHVLQVADSFNTWVVPTRLASGFRSAALMTSKMERFDFFSWCILFSESLHLNCPVTLNFREKRRILLLSPKTRPLCKWVCSDCNAEVEKIWFNIFWSKNIRLSMLLFFGWRYSTSSFTTV